MKIPLPITFSHSVVPIVVEIKRLTTTCKWSNSCKWNYYQWTYNGWNTKITLRRSESGKKSVISDDYVVYLKEHKFDIGIDNDPVFCFHKP